MFTGIVQALCPLTAIRREGGIVQLGLDLGELSGDLVEGASVAVNGVCLTVVKRQAREVFFDAIPQTLEHSNLGKLVAGDRANVERSFKAGDEIGGHTVSGHISGVAEILAVKRRDLPGKPAAGGGSRELTLRMPPHLMKFLFDKGFVALDGASLTISGLERDNDIVRVNLIPETLARTTFGFKQAGDQVNVEVDATTQAIVETVERILGDRDWQESVGFRPVCADPPEDR